MTCTAIVVVHAKISALVGRAILKAILAYTALIATGAAAAILATRHALSDVILPFLVGRTRA
jgi:hypothetical protein